MDIAPPLDAPGHDPAMGGLGYGTRRRWMKALALAKPEDLEEAWAALADRPDYQCLRGPETGLIMVRGRAGGTGGAFNLGEMSVTRCTVQLEEHLVGHAYISGTDARHAELAAIFDALMQDRTHGDALEETLIAPLLMRREAKQREASTKVASSRVEFFTVVRGEDK